MNGSSTDMGFKMYKVGKKQIADTLQDMANEKPYQAIETMCQSLFTGIPMLSLQLIERRREQACLCLNAEDNSFTDHWHSDPEEDLWDEAWKKAAAQRGLCRAGVQGLGPWSLSSDINDAPTH